MELSKLVATPQQCKELQALGIICPAYFHYKFVNDDDKPGQWVVSLNFLNGLPAWTLDEINVMIGPDLPKADFWQTSRLSKAQEPLTYPVHLPSTLKVFRKAAEASAEGLIFMLTNQLTTAEEAVKRYNHIFKP